MPRTAEICSVDMAWQKCLLATEKTQKKLQLFTRLTKSLGCASLKKAKLNW